MWVTHVGAECEGCEPFSSALLGCRQGTRWEVEKAGHKAAPISDSVVYRSVESSHQPQHVIFKKVTL